MAIYAVTKRIVLSLLIGPALVAATQQQAARYTAAGGMLAGATLENGRIGIALNEFTALCSEGIAQACQTAQSIRAKLQQRQREVAAAEADRRGDHDHALSEFTTLCNEGVSTACQNVTIINRNMRQRGTPQQNARFDSANARFAESSIASGNAGSAISEFEALCREGLNKGCEAAQFAKAKEQKMLRALEAAKANTKGDYARALSEFTALCKEGIDVACRSIAVVKDNIRRSGMESAVAPSVGANAPLASKPANNASAGGADGRPSAYSSGGGTQARPPVASVQNPGQVSSGKSTILNPATGKPCVSINSGPNVPLTRLSGLVYGTRYGVSFTNSCSRSFSAFARIIPVSKEAIMVRGTGVQAGGTTIVTCSDEQGKDACRGFTEAWVE